MASLDPSEGLDDSGVPTQQGCGRTGKYLTARAREFLRKRLDNRRGWYKLGIELGGFEDLDLQNIATQLNKLDGSPTLELLRVYEERMGGANEEHLRRCLELMGRNDIITDIQDILVDSQGNPFPLVETRERQPAVERQRSTPLPSNASQSMPTSPSQSQLQPHTDIVINGGTVHIHVPPGTQYVHSSSNASTPNGILASENGGSHPGNGDESTMREDNTTNGNMNGRHSDVRNALTSDHGDRGGRGGGAPSDRVTMRPPREEQSTIRPNSDPVQRKVTPTPDAHVPQNMKGTSSDPSFNGSRNGDVICVKHDKNPLVPRQREEESTQQRPDYLSLTSVEDAVENGARPSPVAQESCFLISTIAEKDQKWFERINRPLQRNNLLVYNVNARSPLQQLYSRFYEATFVVVVYTRIYEAEIKTERSLNGYFFKKIKEEYRRNGNVNRRFVPIYDTKETELLPNALLRCDPTVQRKVLALLTPCNTPHQSPGIYPAPDPWQQNNLSPPSPAGTTMNDRSALGGQRSQSAPHIICEAHAHPAPAGDQPKPKERKNFKFWKKVK